MCFKNLSVPWLELDEDALRHNLAQVRRYAPTSRIWAVVKAQAYGHGLAWVTQVLQQAVDGFAVARVDEAVQLRHDGITKPLLVLEGASTLEELAVAAHQQLTLVLHQEDQRRQLIHYVRHSTPVPLTVWIKVDTGMHRLGFAPDRVADCFNELAPLRSIIHIQGLLTHLANADQPHHPLNLQQVRLLKNCISDQKLLVSIANSAAVVTTTALHGDWVRPGLMLYGAAPCQEQTAASLDLRPVMTLKSRLLAIQHMAAQAAIGYNGTYLCPEDMPVGVVGIGYGDGYPRSAPTGTPVLIGSQFVPLIGRVSMDLITVDLRAAPHVQIGDIATLWGHGLPVETIATAAQTISYELFCRITSRVRRYTMASEL
jgi:alanine racemase